MGTNKKPKKRLVSMDTEEVSLVNMGANGHKEWLLVKVDEETVKAVPGSDASDEDKRAAQQTRAQKYGIEALESGANLSYPSGDPTTESLYGDPVNLKYPLGYTANTRDAGRIRNAISRFKGNHGSYSKDTSKARIYERIVRAALAEDIDVSYDPEDEIDKLLPADLKTRLAKDEEDTGKEDDTNEDAGSPPASPEGEPSNETTSKSGQGTDLVADFKTGLEKSRQTLARVQALAKARELKEQALQAIEAVKKASVDNGPSSPKNEVGKDEPERVDTEKAELKKQASDQAAEIQRLKKELKKEKAKKSRVSTAIGMSQSLQTREIIQTAKGQEEQGEESNLFDLSPPLEKVKGD